MPSDAELRGKRVVVGLLAVGCLVGGLLLSLQPDREGLQAILLRVGLLLGAIWLALPTPDRPAAWARFSPWTIVGLVLLMIFLPRFKFLLPAILIFAAIAWLVRPRKR